MTATLVVGGGVNGLVCALRLARAGHAVTVLEAAVPGGLAAPRSIAPGLSVPVAHLAPPPDPRLGLSSGVPLPTTVLGAEGPLTVRGGWTEGPDAAAWAELHARLSRFAAVLAPMRALTPPRLTRQGAPLWALARRGLAMRTLGTADFREFLRVLLTNLANLAEDHLSDPRLRALLAFDGTLGAWTGPRSPNSLMLWLDRQAAGPVAPTGVLVARLVAAAAAAGVTVRSGARVASIDPDGRALTLADGARIAADRIVSTLAPQVTLGRLVAARALDTGLARRLRALPARGATAKLHLVLEGTPDFGSDPGHRLVFATSVEQVESAWNPVKYSETPAAPVLEVLLHPAGDGRCLLSAVVQFAPHAPKRPDEARAALLAAALDVLKARATGMRILHSEMLMPRDIEAMTGAPGGAWHHVDPGVERMFFLRPLYELSAYATPVPNLWLAGAGTHPGGGLSGTAGVNAAEAILAATPAPRRRTVAAPRRSIREARA
jgi:phytoene dehydrogenase-like protein